MQMLALIYCHIIVDFELYFTHYIRQIFIDMSLRRKFDEKVF